MQYTKHLFLTLCTLGVVLTACIDEYELPASETESMVVIYGQIASNSDCTFTVRTTSTPDGELNIFSFINEAQVRVEGSDGQRFEGHALSGQRGKYVVPVGELKPDAEYHVAVSTPYGDFESEPTRPLDGPELADAYYEQPRPDKEVDYIIQTDDPHGLAYLLWQVDEYWEIRTPFITHWEYRIDTLASDMVHEFVGAYVRLTDDELTNHGWQHSTVIPSFASNEAYGCGAIPKYRILHRTHSDHRFQTRCCVRIKQMAITREEYEFRRLQQVQAVEVGGLFAQMPSQLPTNIRSLGRTRGLGYVGVRGRTSTREFYIDDTDVKYFSQDHPFILPPEWHANPYYMLEQGYRVLDYVSDKDSASWTRDWCVDARSSYWGGDEAIACPDFWQKKEDNDK